MYYRVRDFESDRVLIPFERTNNATRLSTDSKGMYFDFYMDSLAKGRTYVFDFLIKDRDSDRIFTNVPARFRVEK